MFIPSVLFSQSSSVFYYSFDQQVALTPIPNAYTVCFPEDAVDEGVLLSNGLDFTAKASHIYEFQLIIKDSPAALKGVQFPPEQRELLCVSFNFLTSKMDEERAFEYHMVQKEAGSGQVLGGEVISVRLEPRAPFVAIAGEDHQALRDDPITLTATSISEEAVYNWYDSQGVLVHTGPELSITAELSEKYKLEVIADADGFKDVDDVDIDVRAGAITSLSPNPAVAQVNVFCDVRGGGAAYLMIRRPFDAGYDNYILDEPAQSASIDLSVYPTGIYSVILVVDGVMVDQKAVVVE